VARLFKLPGHNRQEEHDLAPIWLALALTLTGAVMLVAFTYLGLTLLDPPGRSKPPGSLTF
jgi:hypothetical protein